MKNQAQLLIDEDCPMCKHYGNFLEKRKIVEIHSYQQSVKEKNIMVDYQKAKNQIALIDHESNKVLYGVDALLHAFRDVLPRLTAWFKNDFLYKIATAMYSFVSYNRKVIAPSPKRHDYLCVPDFELSYRWAYIILVGILSSMILHNYAIPINEFADWTPSFYREILICFGQVAWQAFVFRKWETEYKYEYLGNMMTVSMMGSLLLIPMLLIQNIWNVHVFASIAYFFIVVSIMLFEHMRRCKILGLSLAPSISWVSYRIIVMILLILLK